MVTAGVLGLKKAQSRVKRWDLGVGVGAQGGPRPALRPSSPSREAPTLQTPHLCLLLRLCSYLSGPRVYNSPVIPDKISFCQICQHLTLSVLYFFGPRTGQTTDCSSGQSLERTKSFSMGLAEADHRNWSTWGTDILPPFQAFYP